VLTVSLIILAILGIVAVFGVLQNSQRKQGEDRGAFGLGPGKDDDEALLDVNGHNDDDPLITAENGGGRGPSLSFEFNGSYEVSGHIVDHNRNGCITDGKRSVLV